MITIRPVEETTATLYAPDGTLIGDIVTVTQLYDVRHQIMRSWLSGYYITWFDYKIMIGPDGSLSSCPRGFFDLDIFHLNALTEW